MSLQMLLKALEAGVSGNVATVLMQVVHAVIERFDETDRRQDEQIAALKEMVLRLEDREEGRREGVRADFERQLGVLTARVDAMALRMS
jgi:hypothetical protein